ncbi:hypothetical protein [Streptococcus oricebi]|uniref:NAD(P)-dependent oxidoreductase n=1 Tax=Streptococcus oricebi TaxID=1547447 RepID=A0ABS5B4B7_9STRE|nr:hypothetical protein [Streptococcus oricebi]MBP2623654.1 hypothetical protein [Streptococcus oricebi]
MKTLLIGNTSYITKEFINTAFPSSSVFIFGPTELKTSKKSNITVFSTHIRENLIEEVFESYEFDQIVYLSNSLTYKNKDVGELEYLQSVLTYINDHKDLKFIYLTGPETENHEQVISRMAQGLCLNWENHSSVSVKVLQSPYFYSATNPHDYLYQIFQAIEQGEALEFPEPKKQIANFINLDDVADLLYKILDSWEAGTELLAIENPFQITYENFVQSLNDLSTTEGYHLGFKDMSQEQIVYVNRYDRVIRHRYGWLIRHSIVD